MHDYLFPAEVVRFAFVCGIVVSMLMYERRHLTTGSIVVPGYMGLFLIQPIVVLATLLNAFVSYWVVNTVLPRWFLLYGRTKFTVIAVTSIALQSAMLQVSPSGPYLWETDIALVVGAGYVVPALVAHDMGRQGIAKTTKSVLLSGVFVAIPIAVALLFRVPGIDALAPVTTDVEAAIEPSFIPLAVMLSALTGWALLSNHGLRSGGFIGAAYIGILLASPLQVLFVFAVAVATYFVTTRALMQWMILFGRRKFAAMLFVSGVISWSAIWFGENVLGIPSDRYLALGSIALTPLFLPGLMANDMERSNPGRVMLGTVIGATFVVPAVWVVESSIAGTGVPPVLFGLSLAMGAFVFKRQLVTTGTVLLSIAARAVLGARGRHHRSVRDLLDPDPAPHTVPGLVSVSIDLRTTDVRLSDAA